MNLHESVLNLAKKDPNTIVKIGASGGSSFFFVGSAQEYLEKAKTCDELCLDEAKQTIRNNKANLIRLDNDLTWERFVAIKEDEARKQGIRDTKYMINEAQFIIHQHRVEKKIKRCEKNLAKNELYLENFIMPSEREVEDFFIADPIVDTAYVIIISGTELGKYWTLEERNVVKGGPIALNITIDHKKMAKIA